MANMDRYSAGTKRVHSKWKPKQKNRPAPAPSAVISTIHPSSCSIFVYKGCDCTLD